MRTVIVKIEDNVYGAGIMAHFSKKFLAVLKLLLSVSYVTKKVVLQMANVIKWHVSAKNSDNIQICNKKNAVPNGAVNSFPKTDQYVNTHWTYL